MNQLAIRHPIMKNSLLDQLKCVNLFLLGNIQIIECNINSSTLHLLCTFELPFLSNDGISVAVIVVPGSTGEERLPIFSLF